MVLEKKASSKSRPPVEQRSQLIAEPDQPITSAQAPQPGQSSIQPDPDTLNIPSRPSSGFPIFSPVQSPSEFINAEFLGDQSQYQSQIQDEAAAANQGHVYFHEPFFPEYQAPASVLNTQFLNLSEMYSQDRSTLNTPTNVHQNFPSTNPQPETDLLTETLRALENTSPFFDPSVFNYLPDSPAANQNSASPAPFFDPNLFNFLMSGSPAPPQNPMSPTPFIDPSMYNFLLPGSPVTTPKTEPQKPATPSPFLNPNDFPNLLPATTPKSTRSQSRAKSTRAPASSLNNLSLSGVQQRSARSRRRQSLIKPELILPSDACGFDIEEFKDLCKIVPTIVKDEKVGTKCAFEQPPSYIDVHNRRCVYQRFLIEVHLIIPDGQAYMALADTELRKMTDLGLMDTALFLRNALKHYKHANFQQVARSALMKMLKHMDPAAKRNAPTPPKPHEPAPIKEFIGDATRYGVQRMVLARSPHLIDTQFALLPIDEPLIQEMLQIVERFDGLAE